MSSLQKPAFTATSKVKSRNKNKYVHLTYETWMKFIKNQQMMNMGHGTKDGNKLRGKLSFSTYLEYSVFSHFYTSNIFLKHLKTLIFIKKNYYA